MKIVKFWSIYFFQLTIYQHWFRKWLGAEQATANYLNQLWSSLLTYISLQWRHNGHDGVSNHHPHGCLLNHLFRRRSKKTAKLLVTGHCEGNSLVSGEFPAQRASNAENVSICWRHHDASLDLNGLIMRIQYHGCWCSIWQRREPSHQQSWYWLSSSGALWISVLNWFGNLVVNVCVYLSPLHCNDSNCWNLHPE